MRTLLALLGSMSLGSALAAAETAPAHTDYAAVAAILEARCTKCHGPVKAKENLRLDTIQGILKGSDKPVVVAGDPDASLIYTLAALPAGAEDCMPPKGERLTADELATIRAWIVAGATSAVVAAPAH